MMLKDLDIDLLKYVKGDKLTDEPHKETLTQGYHSWIRVLIAFINYLDFEKEIEIKNVTNETFNNYWF